MEYTRIIYGFAAALCAALLSFTITPMVRVLAYKIGAIDVPSDKRRMHKKPIPRIGGLAIFMGFLITALIFCEFDSTMLTILVGGFMLVALGVVDDVFRVNAWVKLAVQILAALVAVSQGIKIEHINLAGTYVNFGAWSSVITVLWIVGLTNAVNFIDGLDGLACGVSAISSTVLLLVTLIIGEPGFVLITAILAGACMGFLPFNSNPAKIFMGDTGALFLGYALSIIAVSGVYKTHMILSFMIPIAVFGFPLLDTLFAIIRRVIRGKSPFAPDRGHLHHRLIDMGFGQKQSVRILYAISGILGISAIMLTQENLHKSAFMIIVALVVFLINYIIFKNPKTREQSGIYNSDKPEAADEQPDNKGSEEDSVAEEESLKEIPCFSRKEKEDEKKDIA